MEFINENKTDIIKRYLSDPEIRAKMKQTQELQCQMRRGAIFQRTEWVTPTVVAEVTRRLTSAIAPPRLLQVQPILLKNQCHFNSAKMCQYYPERYTRLMGYNFTACPCGKMFSLELHSVIRDNTTDEWLDLTRDFGEETSKWFIPFKENPHMRDTYILKDEEFRCDFVFSDNKPHKCGGCEWRPNSCYPCGEDVWSGVNAILRMVREDRIYGF